MSTFSGFGPFLADEIVARTQRDGSVPRDAIREELLQLGEVARTGEFVPVFITDEHGLGIMVYPMPSVQFPPDRQHARVSINEALDALFRSLVGRSLIDGERSQTLTAIRRAQATRKQALKSIERTIAESARADGYRRTGELLLANLNAFETGAKSVTLTNYFDPDLGESTIELDEKLTPQQNAERYFKRYQKARDSVATALRRQAGVTRELELLETADRACPKRKNGRCPARSPQVARRARPIEARGRPRETRVRVRRREDKTLSHSRGMGNPVWRDSQGQRLSDTACRSSE